ncbi:MAG: hypothetical protein AAF560_15545, partial [Acidobacteriota bacterium]
PLTLCLALVLVLGAPRTIELLKNLAKHRTEIAREAEWGAFGRALPPGARVAAEWGSTHLYMYWAPQATFLNVLDPIFMATPYPQAYRTLRAIFDGHEPDIPMALTRELHSDYIALPTFHQNARLRERLAADPRLRVVHQAYTSLYQVMPDANAGFVLDWHVVPAGNRLPLANDVSLGELAPYPRPEDPGLRAIEAFVDANRLPAPESSCVGLVTALPRVDDVTSPVYQLTPYGSTRVWLDQKPLLAVDQASAAVLGQGITFPIQHNGEPQRLTVLTCPGPQQRTGFFLQRR